MESLANRRRHGPGLVVESMPTTFLIGADGRILWHGHPLAKISGKDINDRIDEVLNSQSQGEEPAKVTIWQRQSSAVTIGKSV